MLLAGVFYEKIALSHMGFPDFTVLQMGISRGSREINYSHPQWRIFEASDEEDQDNINVSDSLSKMSLDFALKICEKM